MEKKKSKSKEKDIHHCERTINGKEGVRSCGKIAKNELKGIWYCGTESVGCYKSALAASKNDKSDKKKIKDVADKVVMNDKIQVFEIAPKLYGDIKTRILFDKKTNEAYGKLDSDNKTVLPLDDDAIRFLETHNQKIKDAKKKLSRIQKEIQETPIELEEEPDVEEAEEGEVEEVEAEEDIGLTVEASEGENEEVPPGENEAENEGENDIEEEEGEAGAGVDAEEGSEEDDGKPEGADDE